MKIYLAGPMRGYKDFNFPAFHAAAAALRALGHEVFNPAEKDEEMYGSDVSKSETGDLAEATSKGFDLRKALGLDLAWICAEADGIYLLPGWERSKGANAERATAVALDLQVFEQTNDNVADFIAATPELYINLTSNELARGVNIAPDLANFDGVR